MKPKFILMSHGHMAEETLNSAKMIAGDLVDADVVGMEAEDGLSGTQEKLSAVLDQLGDQQVLVIADLKGGTPCNAAMMELPTHPKMRVISGLNLAMVIEGACTQIEDVEELADYLKQIGKETVDTMIIQSAGDEEEYEE